jgi:quercetin dioxygenase-like cupin family protein
MRIRTPLLVAALASLLVTGVALATHQAVGLSSSVQARGSWDRGDHGAFLAALAAQGKAASTEVAVVKASLTADGYTFWHGHPGPSVVVVTAGEITVVEPTPNGDCASRTYGVGDAFFHGTSNHDFRNEGSVTAEFTITYFVTSWPPLTHTEDPGVC